MPISEGIRNTYQRDFRHAVAIFIAICVLLSGCKGDVVSSPTSTTHITVPTITLTPASPPSSTPTQATVPTPISSQTLEPTQDINPISSGATKLMRTLLIDLSDSAIGGTPDRPREEVWLLENDMTKPQPLLKSSQFSFESPVWSHDGEWIAFKQRDIASGNEQVGLIRADGTLQHLALSSSFGAISKPSWSWDDQWLVFATVNVKREIGYAVNVSSGAIQMLNPDAKTQYSDIWLLASPQADQALFIDRNQGAATSVVELWLVSLDQPGEKAPIPKPKWIGCASIESIDWAPDGKSFLVQPGNDIPNKGSCEPGLWLYDIEHKTWTEVAKPPQPGPGYQDLWRIDWSPDGRWVVWADSEQLLVYDSKTWQVGRELRMKANQFWLRDGWTKYIDKESVLVIAEHDYAHPPHSYTLQGFSPTSTAQNNNGLLLANISRNPDWLPRNAQINYEPIALQP